MFHRISLKITLNLSHELLIDLGVTQAFYLINNVKYPIRIQNHMDDVNPMLLSPNKIC